MDSATRKIFLDAISEKTGVTNQRQITINCQDYYGTWVDYSTGSVLGHGNKEQSIFRMTIDEAKTILGIKDTTKACECNTVIYDLYKRPLCKHCGKLLQ